jgi:hypothetical protein
MSDVQTETLQNLREVFTRALLKHAENTIAQSGEREFDVAFAARTFLELQAAVDAIDRAIAKSPESEWSPSTTEG